MKNTSRKSEQRCMRALLGGISMFALCMAGTTGAFAQVAEPQAGENRPDEIIVTANKRAEALIDTAGVINVISGETIERIGATGAEDVLRLTPGAIFQRTTPDSSIVTIRGVTTGTTTGINQAPVGIYIGDVPINDPTFVSAIPDISVVDLEAVEVLRGPQGVLYGSASLSGALRYQFAAPDLSDEFGGFASASLSTVDDGDLGYGVSGGLNLANPSGTAALRVVGFYREDGGYIDNVLAGVENSNGYKQYGGRISGLIAPSDTFQIKAIFHYQKADGDDLFSVDAPVSELELTTRPTLSTRDTEFIFANLVADWDLGFATLSSSTGYWEKNVGSVTDFTLFTNNLFGLPFPEVISISRNRTSAISQEVRLASNPDPDGRLSWIAGAFYQDLDPSIAAETVLPDRSLELIKQGLSGAEANELAIFADLEYKLTDRLTIGAGGRYYDTSYSGDVLFEVFGAPSGVPANSGDNGFAPRVSIEYAWTDDVKAYLRYSRGFRFGGPNVISPNPAFPSPIQFVSDQLNAYEAGLKLQSPSGLSAEVAAFYYDWKDAQVNVTRPDFFVYTDNVGEARVVGAEVSLAYTSRTIDLAANMTYSDAETRVPLGGAPGAPPVPLGSPLPGSPNFQSFATATYKFFDLFGNMDGYLNASHSYIGSYFDSIEQFNEIGDYHRIDLAFGLDLSESLSFTINARNLNNSRGVAGASFLGGVGDSFFVIQPRTVTFGLNARF